MLSRQWRLRLAIAALLAVGGGALSMMPGAELLQRMGIDALLPLRQAVYGPLYPPSDSDVVVVAIDEQSYRSEPFRNTPKVAWTPHIARVLEAIDAAEPKAIGLDVIYPTSLDRPELLRGYDRPFLLALRKLADKDRLVLGAARLSGETLEPYPGQIAAAKGRGNLRLLNLDVDRDDVVRGYFSAFADDAGGTTPSFGVELAKRAGAAPPNGDFLINFNTGPGDVPVHSMVDLWSCDDPAYFARHFRGKIVLFGEMLDLEDRFLSAKRLAMTTRADAHAAPERCRLPADPERFGALGDRRTIPGVLIHAAAINTVTKGIYVSPLSGAISFLVVGGSVMIFAILFFLMKPGTGLIAGAGVLAVEIGMAVVDFAHGVVVPIMLIAITGFLAYAVVYAYRFIVEDREKRWIQHAFRHYLAPVLVDRLAADPSALRLGGEKRRVTVFFSDIAGFTTISERLRDRPERLVEILNKYLTVMTDAVEARGGYVDKYIGDAVMAIWNAPLDDADADWHAVEAALDCLKALERFNAEIVVGEYDMTPIGTRIGIHAGTAIVGNMGSRARLNYTATGDTVNLAARLEGANKEYGSHIMISEDVMANLGEGFLLRRLDRLVVKGKKQPVEVFEVIGRREDMAETEPRIRAFHAALAFYDRRDFPAAEAAFAALSASDAAAAIYAERCRHYRSEPPPPDWNGAFAMKTK
ncbi:MAG: adenylate/guanylate cyclase domain-containing protein [Alphaproteobacteria bacterium]|nr:adenylate/guanylate cyclase domain-containing protein [Alphaproteobacteria bacterium]